MWIKSLLLVAVLAGSLIGSSMAYFSDTETSTGNSFTAGTIDLLVNGQNNPTALVNLDDLKPGDIRTVDKWLDVSSNPASAYLHIDQLIASQGTQTEPENQEEEGTPKFDLQNYINYSLVVDGTPVIATESSTLLSQASSCYIPLGVVTPGEALPMQQVFSLPAEVTNWAQGDRLTFNEVFYAQQTRNNPIDPVTGTGRIWNSSIQKCEQCTFNTLMWVSEASGYAPGNRRNGTSVLAARTNPDNTKGANDTDNPPNNNKFLSLGFGGKVILKFPNVIQDGAGADLKVYEVTGGRNTYPTESAKVEVSLDGSNWYGNLAVTSEPSGDGINEVDVAGALNEFQYLRITDTTNPSLFSGAQYVEADGFDIDAVEALHGKSCTSELD